MTLNNSKQRYLCKYYYIGSGKFHGSQKQLGFLTVEDVIIATLKKKNYIKDIDSSKINFASRTDKFVSARGATFSFITNKKLILMEINSALPKDIGIWSFCKVPIEFSSRHDARLRHYKYIVPEPLDTLRDLDFELVKKACSNLTGHHNFANFCKREREQKYTTRDLEVASARILNQHVMFDFKSRGFLRQQIRRMVKKIMEVGMKRITLKEFNHLLEKSKHISYEPADPTGLILWDISYGKDVNFEIDHKSLERMQGYFFKQMINHGLKKQLFLTLQQDDFSQQCL